MTGIPSSRPEFFGKDDFVPFIGRVEDVNDPKHGHRVKVRCIGWHPKSKKSSKDGSEDGLSTDDLPWARVAMPVTHAQQGRIGGKHGLLNGCWVFGFFLDGQEAQDPMVLNTINFTPNASGEDDRQTLKGEDGKDAEEDDAFNKSMPSTKTQPNAALRTEQENSKTFGHEADTAGDGHNYDHDATKCGGKAVNESKAAKERKKQENTTETASAQNTDMLQGDGRCGTTMHARDDMRAIIKRYMPPGDSRFNYQDAVWNNYSGQYMNLGGIMAQMALLICSELKQPINSQKASVNRILRGVKSTVIKALPDRDGLLRDKVEDKKSMAGDSFNATMQTSLIDTLCDLMMKMLQAMQNGGDPSTGVDGPGGRSPTTPILDPGAQCITDTLLRNVEVIVESTIEFALLKAAADEEEYDPDDNPLFGAGMGFLMSLSSVMQFPLIDVYAEVSGAFNKKGNKSQDADNKSGECRQDRVYNTELGSLMSIAGIAAGGGGGSGGGGQGSRGGVTLPDVGFGGKDRNDDSDPTNLLCDDAYKRPKKDRGEPTAGGGMPIDDEFLKDLRCSQTKQCPKGYVCIDGRCISKERDWPDDIIDEGLIPCEGGTDLFDGIGSRRRYLRNNGCPDGMVCFNGYCVPEEGLLECSEDEDCPEGTICISGICVSDGNEFDEPGPFAGIGGENYVPGAGNDFQEPGEFQGIGKEGYILGAQNKFIPGGEGARVIATSLPSSDIRCARNFFNGTPNQCVVIRKGERYFFNNPEDDTRVFPSVFIQGYASQPIPVVDRFSGEMVAVLTACSSFNPNAPIAPVSLIPDSSTTGIVTDDPAYDVVLGGFFISNTGFDYVDPVIQILDRDKDTYENAEATLVVVDGRIVDYEIINNGTQFRRLPEVRIIDRNDTGYGAELYPIMSVIERDKAKPLPEPIQKVFCPSNQQNII